MKENEIIFNEGVDDLSFFDEGPRENPFEKQGKIEICVAKIEFWFESKLLIFTKQSIVSQTSHSKRITITYYSLISNRIIKILTLI